MTTYRAAICCDVQGSVWCHGLVTVEAGDPVALPHLATVATTQKGWQRTLVVGQTATQTRDVCPACRTALRERTQVGGPA